MPKPERNSASFEEVCRGTPDRFAREATERAPRVACAVDAGSLRRLVDENADGILVVDVGGRIVFANPAAQSLFGRPVRELLSELFGRPMIQGEFAEIDIPRPDGSIRTAEMRSVQTQWNGGPGQILSLRDVTDRRSLETQLRQSQKMEALGRLAGGISHDFNNMLTSILCECSALVPQFDPADPRRRSLEQIAQTAENAADLVRQLLTFSRRRVMRYEPLEVNSIAASMERMLRRLMGESITLRFTMSNGPVWAELERGCLEQVILNLVLNARDAMPNGGLLELETHVVADPSSPSAPGWVSITVRDSGMGMTDDVQARLFEPFFTTKGEQGGCGLGLSVVYGIVKQAHGRIVVHSEPNRGSTFQVLLPRREAPAHPAITRVPAAPTAAPRRALSIALAEDEEAVRQTITDVLDRVGHKVIAAEDGAAAAVAFCESECEFDLLITDVTMPRLSGPSLASDLRALDPDLPVLFLSGYPQDDALFDQLAGRRVAFLAKPFTASQLLTAVDTLLGSPAAPPSAALTDAARAT